MIRGFCLHVTFCYHANPEWRKIFGECMDSVASQCLTDMKYEHIIIDSGSTDKTMAIATSYKNVSFIEAGQATHVSLLTLASERTRSLHFSSHV